MLGSWLLLKVVFRLLALHWTQKHHLRKNLVYILLMTPFYKPLYASFANKMSLFPVAWILQRLQSCLYFNILVIARLFGEGTKSQLSAHSPFLHPCLTWIECYTIDWADASSHEAGDVSSYLMARFLLPFRITHGLLLCVYLFGKVDCSSHISLIWALLPSSCRDFTEMIILEHSCTASNR